MCSWEAQYCGINQPFLCTYATFNTLPVCLKLCFALSLVHYPVPGAWGGDSLGLDAN